MNYLWSPWRMAYIQNHNKEQICALCTELSRPDGPENLIVHRSERVFLILNRYPYTSGHLMIVPYDHVSTLGELELATRIELMEVTNQAINVLTSIYHPQGFNVGINIGEAAGAGITEHIHMHVVPRWLGDTNFMSSLGSTRVLPESLEDSFRRIHEAWHHF
ncbi:MAG TPA: HIT domain-containing protein [Anaerolineales bacterium]|nr:HIT domain-containing protein [Anaerolineales bacterium]